MGLWWVNDNYTRRRFNEVERTKNYHLVGKCRLLLYQVEVDKLLEQVTTSSVIMAEVEEMVQQAVTDKASQSDLEVLSAQVASKA